MPYVSTSPGVRWSFLRSSVLCAWTAATKLKPVANVPAAPGTRNMFSSLALSAAASPGFRMGAAPVKCTVRRRPRARGFAARPPDVASLCVSEACGAAAKAGSALEACEAKREQDPHHPRRQSDPPTEAARVLE